jgi:hypothetical protein
LRLSNHPPACALQWRSRLAGEDVRTDPLEAQGERSSGRRSVEEWADSQVVLLPFAVDHLPLDAICAEPRDLCRNAVIPHPGNWPANDSHAHEFAIQDRAERE